MAALEGDGHEHDDGSDDSMHPNAYLVADMDFSQDAERSSDEFDGVPPPIVPRPVDCGDKDVYDGQRFQSLQEADDAISIMFNHDKRRLGRPRKNKNSWAYTCVTLGRVVRRPVCTWVCRAVYDVAAEASWGDDPDQSGAGFVFVIMAEHAHLAGCLGLPDDEFPTAAKACQNMRVESMPRFARRHVREHLTTASVEGVREALRDRICADPGYEAAKRVFRTCIREFIGHPVRSYWKLHSWYIACTLLVPVHRSLTSPAVLLTQGTPHAVPRPGR